jgi:3-oxoacyl-[acyl-carrier protein] reductase
MMLGDGYEQTIQTVIDSTPLQKAADPADIADAVLGIIEGSDMLTGQILLVDGGQNI